MTEEAGCGDTGAIILLRKLQTSLILSQYNLVASLKSHKKKYEPSVPVNAFPGNLFLEK